MTLKGLNSDEKLKVVDDLKRSDEWLMAAIARLQPILDRITVLVGSPIQPIRLELAKLASDLIQLSGRYEI